MKTKILGILAASLGLLSLVSCKDSDVFPDTPYLEYRSYELIGSEQDPVFPLEHALVTLYFTDGDGDIGEKEYDPGEFNFRVSVFEKYDTGYAYAYDWSGILEDLADPGQQNKALEGEIMYKVGLADAGTDTVKFEFELVDDAGHSSGVIESEPVLVAF